VLYQGLESAQVLGQSNIDSLLARLTETREDTNKVNLLNDLSSAYQCINPDEGIKMGTKAMELARKLKWDKGIAKANNNIGMNYYGKSDYTKSLEYYSKALEVFETTKNLRGTLSALGNIITLYISRSDYQKALEYLYKALKINKGFGDKEAIAGNFASIGRICVAVALDSSKVQLYHLFSGSKRTALRKAMIYSDSAILTGREIDAWEIMETAYASLGVSQEMLGDYKSALGSYHKYMSVRDSVIKNVVDKKMSDLEKKYNEELRQKQMDIKDLEISKAFGIPKSQRWYFVAGLFLLACLSAIFYNRFRLKNKANKIIIREKKFSEEMLSDILPSQIAEELKKTGKVKALRYPSITVMFTDFKDFSRFSEALTPEQLTKELDFYFAEFDKIIYKYGLEKIKTIGDSYMCAGGLPSMNFTHPEDVVAAALEIRDFIINNKKECEASGKKALEIRIGINTGSAVAGIIGVKRFAYDIWGDTVNLASRMQSCGETGKVNISGSTYGMVKDKFACTYRGKIEAKNKGLIDMYFVEAYK